MRPFCRKYSSVCEKGIATRHHCGQCAGWGQKVKKSKRKLLHSIKTIAVFDSWIFFFQCLFLLCCWLKNLRLPRFLPRFQCQVVKKYYFCFGDLLIVKYIENFCFLTSKLG